MTFIIPFIPLITAAVTVATTLYSAKQQKDAAKKQQQQSNIQMQAAEEQDEIARIQEGEIAARQEESAREARVLAEQNAEREQIENDRVLEAQQTADLKSAGQRRAIAAASGVATGGSQSMFLQGERAAEERSLAQQTEAARSREDITRAGGKQAERIGLTDAAMTRAGAQQTRAGATSTRAAAIGTQARANASSAGAAGSFFDAAVGVGDALTAMDKQGFFGSGATS